MRDPIAVEGVRAEPVSNAGLEEPEFLSFAVCVVAELFSGPGTREVGFRDGRELAIRFRQQAQNSQRSSPG